jgi:penicillin-binding protein 2
MTRQPLWKLNARLLFVALMLLGMGGYLCWGLMKLSVEETESYQAAVRATSVVTTYQSGTRGTITDRYGNVLAYDETTYNVKFYRDPDKTSPIESARYTHSLMEAIRIIEAGGGTIEEHFYIKLNNDGTYRYDFGVTSEAAIASRKKNFVDACRFSDPDISPERAYLILRESWQIPDDMPYDEAKKIMSIRQDAVLNSWHAYEGVVIAYDVNLSVVTELDMLQSELIGVQTEMSGRRIYPYADTACHLIGYLSKQVTTDMTHLGYSFDSFAPFVEGEPSNNLLQLGYSYSDLIGVAGLEKSCEAYLTSHLISRQGTTTIEKTKTGSIVNVLGKTVPQGGFTVKTSLDIELQQVAEKALLHNIEVTRESQERKIQKDYKKYSKLRDDTDDIARAETGAIVVMNVQTGEVLAIASYPTYDPNIFTDGVDSRELQLLFGENSNQPTLNRAIAIRTAPGSVFKMATGFAGLMEGAITTTSTISDHSPYYYFVDDPTTKVTANAPSCWTTTPWKHANLNLSRALAVSCNYFFFTVADRVGIKKLAYWAGQLGLEGTTGVELPGELAVQVGGQAARYDNTKSLSQQSSSIPRLIYNEIHALLKRIVKQVGREVSDESLTTCATRLLKLQDGEQRERGDDIRRILNEELNIPMGISLLHTEWIVTISTWLEELRWKPTYTIQSGIGQGVSLLTPISVARYAATVATRGEVHKATLLNGVYYPDGTLYEKFRPQILRHVDAPEEYWDAILTGMAGVVSPEDGGTASSVFSKGFSETFLKQIIGKTGTAQTSANRNVDIENTSWFVAVTPRENPEIVVVVMIPNGLSGSASHVAVEDVITWWYENRANQQLLSEPEEQEMDPELEALLQPDEEIPEDQGPDVGEVLPDMEENPPTP